MMKTGNRVIGIVLALALLAGPVTPALAADIQDAAALGELTHYNGIVFSRFSCYSGDIEGAFAVGGEAEIGTGGYFSFGAGQNAGYAQIAIGSYENPNQYPSLLLEEAPWVGANVSVYGGPFALAEGAEAAYLAGENRITGTTKTAEDGLVEAFFAGAQVRARETAAVLDRANTGESISLNQFTGWQAAANLASTYGDLTRFEPDNLVISPDSPMAGARVLVLDIHTDSYAEINEPHITAAFADYDLIVFNLPDAVSVRFTGSSVHVDGKQLDSTAPGWWYPEENALLGTYAEKIVWNLPAARTVQLTACGVVGSVLAPDAYVQATGGSINGMLVADSFVQDGGMGLHAFSPIAGLFDLDNGDAGPEEPYVGSVRLVKANESGDLLAGAAFDLMQGDRLVYTGLTTDTRGEIRVDHLPEGEYYFVETRAPEGYLPDGTPYPFTIARGEPDPVLTVTNRRTTAQITLRKVDGEGVGLPGAEFALYTGENGQWKKLRNVASRGPEGEITLEDLPYPGRYLLEETAAPEGYYIEAEYRRVYIAIDELGSAEFLWGGEDGKPLGADADHVPVIPNEKRETPAELWVELRKLDERGYPLEGVGFALYRVEESGSLTPWPAEGENVATTDGDGRVVFAGQLLSPGRYYVDELPLPGYEGAEGESFTIPDGGVVQVYREIVNRAVTGTLTVNKVDGEAVPIIPEAAFSLYRVEGRQLVFVQSLTTVAGRAVAEGLTPGRYALVETAAPEGYTPGETEHFFTIAPDEDGNVVDITLDIVNYDMSDPVTVARLRKVDGVDGSPVPGSVFSLARLNAGRDEEVIVDRAETDEAGQITVTGLDAGIYILREEESAEGYELAGDGEVVFYVPEAGGVSRLEGPGYLDLGTMVLENARVLESREVDVRKLDAETGAPLAGSGFALVRLDRGIGAYATELVTGEDGKITLAGLTPGSYQLVELLVPPGYHVPGREDGPLTIPFTVTEDLDLIAEDGGEAYSVDGDTGLITVYNGRDPQFPHMQLIKQNGSGTPLPGALFALLHRGPEEADYDLYATVTSNAEGQLLLPELTEGEYRLEELRAPAGYALQSRVFAFTVRWVEGELQVVYGDTVLSEEGAGALVIYNHTGEHTAFVEGYPDGQFRPENALTRAEAAQMFYTLLRADSAPRLTGSPRFTDVPADSWYAGAVSSLVSWGVIDDDPDDAFRPHEAITGAEFVEMALRWADGEWAGEGAFSPDSEITRAEAVAVICSLRDCPGLDSGVNFPDVEADSQYYATITAAATDHRH